MSKVGKDILPQNEREWLELGEFCIEQRPIEGVDIHIARTGRDHASAGKLVLMVGGIPRDSERRQNLPLINKLYGNLALKLAQDGHQSIMYNQPGTGLSGGDFSTETLVSRTRTLAGLALEIAEEDDHDEVVLVGMSAGSYMSGRAVDMIESNGPIVRGLALQSPAAYPELAEHVPYGDEFSEIIKSDWEIPTSPIFSDIKRAVSRGTRLLVSFFQKDTPQIPMPIQECYLDTVAAMQESDYDARMYSIYGVEHNFRRLGSDHKGNVVCNDSIRATTQVLRDFVNDTRNT